MWPEEVAIGCFRWPWADKSAVMVHSGWGSPLGAVMWCEWFDLTFKALIVTCLWIIEMVKINGVVRCRFSGLVIRWEPVELGNMCDCGAVKVRTATAHLSIESRATAAARPSLCFVCSDAVRVKPQQLMKRLPPPTCIMFLTWWCNFPRRPRVELWPRQWPRLTGPRCSNAPSNWLRQRGHRFLKPGTSSTWYQETWKRHKQSV